MFNIDSDNDSVPEVDLVESTEKSKKDLETQPSSLEKNRETVSVHSVEEHESQGTQDTSKCLASSVDGSVNELVSDGDDPDFGDN